MLHRSLSCNPCVIGAVCLGSPLVLLCLKHTHMLHRYSAAQHQCQQDERNQCAKTIAENSVPPTLLATLITAQHARPFQPLPMLFPPILLLSSYLNLSNYKTDAAGLTAAWSGLYALLAMRRRQVSPPFPSISTFVLRNPTRVSRISSPYEVWYEAGLWRYVLSM